MRHQSFVWITACLLLSLSSATVHAQQVFELVNQSTGEQATARLTTQDLKIINQNGTSSFVRDPRHDSTGYNAYSSATLGQVIRWPTTNTGAFLVRETNGLLTSWRPGRSVITSSQVAQRPVLPTASATYNLQGLGNDRGTATVTAQDIVFVTTIQGVSRSYRYQRAAQFDTIGYSAYELLTSQGLREIVRWPTSNQGRYQVQTGASPSSFAPLQIVGRQVGNRPALTGSGSTFNLRGTGNDQGTVTISPKEIVFNLTTRGVRRTSRYQRSSQYDTAGYTAYESFSSQGVQEIILWPDSNRGQYQIQTGGNSPIFSPFQIVSGASTGTSLPIGIPRRISRKVVPNPALEPAVIELVNSHGEELWVLVTDNRNPTLPERLKIAPQKSETIRLDRDAGSRIVEVWEIPSAGGTPRLEERVTEVPAKRFYDVSVYELFLQSIAIDRTRKGAGRIEDVNRAPKSVGMFDVPAGPALRDGKTDIYNVAKQQDNPGAVRRIDPAKWNPSNSTSDDPFLKHLRRLGR